jgi:hypothetical protein
MTWVWVLIPVAAILVGAFQEWLKFQEKQAKLGNSTRELGQTMSSLRSSIQELEDERDALTRRVQNLEAIVTSQVWDEAHDRPSSGFLGSDLEGEGPTHREPPSDAETLRKLARRLDR